MRALILKSEKTSVKLVDNTKISEARTKEILEAKHLVGEGGELSLHIREGEIEKHRFSPKTQSVMWEQIESLMTHMERKSWEFNWWCGTGMPYPGTVEGLSTKDKKGGESLVIGFFTDEQYEYVLRKHPTYVLDTCYSTGGIEYAIERRDLDILVSPSYCTRVRRL